MLHSPLLLSAPHTATLTVGLPGSVSSTSKCNAFHESTSKTQDPQCPTTLQILDSQDLIRELLIRHALQLFWDASWVTPWRCHSISYITSVGFYPCTGVGLSCHPLQNVAHLRTDPCLVPHFVFGLCELGSWRPDTIHAPPRTLTCHKIGEPQSPATKFSTDTAPIHSTSKGCGIGQPAT